MEPISAVFTRPALRTAVVIVCTLFAAGCCAIQSIRTEALPDAIVGQPYAFSLEHNCTGKTASQSENWTIVTGASPPPGISLLSDGRFLGMPTAPGLFTFAVQLGSSSTAKFTIQDVRTFSLTVRALSTTVSQHLILRPS